MREKLIRCLKYCATTTDGDHHCGGCERWEYDCGSSHCVDDLMLQAAEALEQQKWIPVTERLPDNLDAYLVVVMYKYNHELEYSYDTDVATFDPSGDAGYIDGVWSTYNDWDEGQDCLTVTHWMPLPEPPKGE